MTWFRNLYRALEFPPRPPEPPKWTGREAYLRKDSDMIPAGLLQCRICDDGTEAVSVFYFDEGCVCCGDRLQALCPQHAISAEPIGGKVYVTGWNTQ